MLPLSTWSSQTSGIKLSLISYFFLTLGTHPFILNFVLYRVCGIHLYIIENHCGCTFLMLLGWLHCIRLLEQRLTFISTIFVPYCPSYRHSSLKQTKYLDLTTGNIFILVKARAWYVACESKYICAESPSVGHRLNCFSFAKKITFFIFCINYLVFVISYRCLC